uniref:GTPase Era n=1 Tax=candidate division WOR-3 bacterium TaxID=2052148 RepID=A0A7C4XM20_UNCW3
MKTGFVAIVGEPNVGKSTLLNRLLKTKISITSSKPQTTRYKILGILTEGEYQCLFLDTPGIIEPAYPLQEFMVQEIKESTQSADIILWMIDPWFKKEKISEKFLKYLNGKTVILVINKIDLVNRNDLLPLIDQVKELKVKEIVPISALAGDGVDDLKNIIFRELPEGPFLYPLEELSDRPIRFFVAELIRENLFEFYKKEIPYSTAVVVEEFKEREKGKDYIRATIYVEKDSQKGILIGKDGAALKRIGEESRRAIEEFTGRPVYLDLWVKVKEKWRRDRKFLKELGY